MFDCGEGRETGARSNAWVRLAAALHAFKFLTSWVFNLTNVIKAGVGTRIIHLLQMGKKKKKRKIKLNANSVISREVEAVGRAGEVAAR